MNQKLKNQGIFIVLLFVITAFVFSCSKEKLNFDKLSDHMEWNPSFGTPLAFASLTMRDILADYDSTELFIEDETQLLSVFYTGKVASLNISDIFVFPNQTYSETFTAGEMDLSGFVNAGDTVRDSKIKDFDLTFDPSDALIDSITIDSASLSISISSTFKHDGFLNIRFPGVIKNNVEYNVLLPFSSETGTFTLDTVLTDFTNCTIDFTAAGTSQNDFKIFYDVTMIHSGNPSTAGEFTMSCLFSNVNYKGVFGYLGQKEVMYSSDTFSLDVLTPSTDAGVLYFEDPKFNIYYENSYGVPISLYFTDMTAFSDEYQTSTPIISYNNSIPIGAANSRIIEYPLLSEFGETKYDSIKLNKSNCNINSAIGDKPKKISFGVKATTNNAGVVYDNFITNNSEIKTRVEVILPLWGYASGFSLQDTTEFDFNKEFEDVAEIDKILLRVNIENGFPIDIYTQAYFTDSLFNIVDSIFVTDDTRIVQSGVVSFDGKINQSTGRTQKITDVTLDRPKVERMKLLNIKHIIMRGFMETKDSPSLIKVYANYSVDFHIGMQVTLLINN